MVQYALTMQNHFAVHVDLIGLSLYELSFAR